MRTEALSPSVSRIEFYGLFMKRTLITVILAVFAASSVFAGFTYSPGIQGNLGASFCYPTADYLKSSQGKELPALRTSLYFDCDAMLANVVFDSNWEVGLGFSLQGTSESLAAGISILQPYMGMGAALAFNRNFENGFAIGLKARYLFCRFRPYNYKFNTVDIAAVPSYRFFRDSGFDILMVYPFTVSVKSDAVTFRLGVGFNVKYNIKLKGQKQAEAEQL